MLRPQWGHLRKASLFRGGIDYGKFVRKILLWDNFQRAPEDISGVKRLQILRTAQRRPESLDLLYRTRPKSDELIVFSGDGNHFADLKGEKSFLLAALRGITNPKWLRVADRYKQIPIAINVRRGKDFTDAQNPVEFATRGAIRTPLEWYIEVLQQLRERIGSPISAYLVSDGTEEDLKPLLLLPNVELVKSASAISDLLILANARVLIGSGGSSFSAWAAFLSGAPTVTHPGQSLQWFNVCESGEQYLGVFDPQAGPAPELIEHVIRTIK